MTTYVDGVLEADTTNLNELSQLALIASDASYKGRLSTMGASLQEFDDTPQYGNPSPPFGPQFLLVSTNYTVDRIFDDPQDQSGFKAIAFRNVRSGDIILAFAGTDGPDARDWWGNVLHLGWNQWQINVPLIRQYLDQFIDADTGSASYRIHFVGQSLGGALAQYAAYDFVSRHVQAPQFDRKKLSLVTFNALGGVAALREKAPSFDIGLLKGLGQAVHYYVENDLVHRLGAGHIGGVTKKFLWTNNTAPAGSAFNRLDPVEAHRIESAFYSHLSGAKGYFDEAVRAPIEYLPVSNIQKLASAFGNIENKSTVRESEAFFQIVAGMIPASIEAPPGEINAVMRAFLTAYRNAGEIAPVKAEILFDTDWSKLMRSVADTNPRLVSESYAGALLLGFLGAAFEKTLDDISGFIEAEFGQVTIPTLEERSLSAYGAQTRLLAERASPGTPLAQAFVDKEELARRLATEQHSIRSAISYLAGAAAGAGLTGIALGTFIAQAFKQAGEAVIVAVTEAGDAVADYELEMSAALADVAHAIANTTDDYLDHAASSLVFPVQTFFPEARALADGLLAAVQETNLLSLFVKDVEAAEQTSSAVSLVSQALQRVSIHLGRSSNPFASPDFDPNASISLGSLSEGSIRTFTLYLPYDAGSGGQRVKLTLAGGAADKLTLLDHGDEVALGADGAFTLVVPEGRKEHSFTLWASQDIDAAETLELKAQLTQLVGTEEVATHQEHVELELALDGVDETTPIAGREIHGDWAPKPYVDPDTGAMYYKYDDLGNIERLPGVPSTGDVEPDQWLDGSSGNDLIVTGDFDERAHGDAGDDFITGSDRSGNVLYGGSGNDRIEGGGWADHAAESLDYLGRTMSLGDDKIYGGAGDDQIWGESEATQAALNDAGTAPTGITGDWLTGGSGADRIYGSAGDDVLLGGIGEDLLVGGAGMDVLLGDDDFQIRPGGNYWQVAHPNFGDSTPGFGGFEVGLFPVVNATIAAPDAVWALSGDPYFAYYKFGGGADTLIGGGGDDILIGEAGDDTLYGGEGDDILAGWEGDDELVGGAGDDMMAGDFGRYEQLNQRTVPGTLLVQAGVMGTPAAYGSAPELTGNDLLDGGAGNDVLYGEGGDDSVLGGDGDDLLYGDADYLPENLHGNDILDGGDGSDVLYAGAGEDALYGGAGDDALYGGPGDDRLEGGGGDDTLSGEEGDDALRAGDGDDVLFGGGGDDVMEALGGDDYLQTGAGNDIMRGGAGADALEAWGEGNNLLDAGPGDDYVYDEGRTLVIGGQGDDWIEHYGDGSVIAFNPGDGDDTVYVVGATTLSIGGGVQPGDLSLSRDGDDLLLDVAGDGSIRLTRQWEADPAAWPEITLQLFGSVHRYDFNAALGTEGPLGDVLAANETSFSETDGLGGAIAWQYAISGSTGALSDEQLGSVLADPGFGTASQPIVLEQPNRPPQLTAPIADQSALEDSPFELSVAAAFTDPDAGDTLGYDAALLDGSPLPAWLALDAASGSLAGTPGNDDVGTLEIAVGATDGEGERAQDAFALEVVNVNDAPTLVAPLPDRSGQEGAALAFSVAGAFADVDAGDALAYAATLADGGALPGWLAFDPASQSFSAAPGYSDGGSYLVRVTATDTAGASASGDFTLSILESEPPVEPGRDKHHGRHGRHDEDHRHPHGRGHDHGRGDDHDDKHGKPKRHHDSIHEWLARPHPFDFEAIVRELERGKPQRHAPSPAEIRAAWERVARHAAKLRAGGDEFEHGAPWRGGDLLRLAPNGGHAFGFDGSTGATRAQEGFTSFKGLSEGFRRL